MTTFCLIHGSTQSSAGWDLLVPELERLGHETVRTVLPNDLLASATRYADLIAASIPEDLEDVVVVAHSASGLFLPLVPSRRTVHQLVFLAAVIPRLGASLLDQLKADPTMMNPEWLGKNPVDNDQFAHQFLFHDCSPETGAWALTTRRLTNARQAVLETCPLERWPDVPCSYILCAGDRTIRPEWSRQAARERLGCEALELPGGHCPHVSRPRALAGMLAAIR